MPDSAAAVLAGRGLRRVLLTVVQAALLVACEAAPSPSPSATASPQPTPTTTSVVSASAIPTGSPTATPEPPLSLELPDERDDRQLRVALQPEVPADGDGRIEVSVTNLSGERVDELVLRWPTELADAVFLAPFEPTPGRIAVGGPPLIQPWTKWVIGPGERGEPAGTTSLGWGPLDPGATLTIPLVASRRAPGPLEFDLQLLAGEALLTLEGGEPAELRVAVP
ncbi:MAG TPA: hypothetical protein VHK28_05630 [Candidatus Limnocylindria bacterium]|nr:hypothetical protein [Candidatus Limnocylindria bacterium]